MADQAEEHGRGRSSRPHPPHATLTLTQLPVHLVVRALEFCSAVTLARFEAVGTDASLAVCRAVVLCAARLHGAAAASSRPPASAACASGYGQPVAAGVLRTLALHTLEEQARWRGRISAGAHHSALVRYGDAFTWGDGKAGRLGQGDERSWLRPTRVYRYDARQFDPALARSTRAPGHRIGVCAIACGEHHTLMLTRDGHVYGCGSNGFGQLGIGARRRNGGDGDDGGGRANAAFSSRECCPMRITAVRVCKGGGEGSGGGASDSDALEEAPLFGRVAAGATSSAMLCRRGRVFVCGASTCSGLDTERTQVYPRRVCLPPTRIACKAAGAAVPAHDEQRRDATADAGSAAAAAEAGGDAVVAVSIGLAHMLLLCRSGAVFACGAGNCGQLGRGDQCASHLPRQVLGLPPSRSVAAGGSHSVAVTCGGSVLTWGHSLRGALGHGHGHSPANVMLPLLVEEMQGRAVAECVAGQHHTVLLCADGTVFSCGQGWQGRLGLGDELDRDTPHEVRALRGHPIAAVAANKSHTLFVTTRGAVFATGEGWKGRLGLGLDTSSRVLPAVVMGADGSVVRNDRNQLHSWERGVDNSLSMLA